MAETEIRNFTINFGPQHPAAHGVLREGQEQGILNNQVPTPILLDFFYGVLLRISQMHLLRGRSGRMADQHGPLFDMLWRAITV
ncbi:MAG: hypothetical protein MI745_03270 [Pseudomonadales bacterium]|nr:hypothetical protein [Pseudomonadales bacterium]